MTRLTILTITSAIALAACGTTIRPGERGLKYTAFGKPGLQTKVRSEGFYFQWPWNSIVKYDVTLQSRTEKVDVLTKDNLHIRTSVTVTFRPDVQRLHQLALEVGPQYYAEVIQPAFTTIARSEFAAHEHNKLPEESPQIERAILGKLRDVVKGKPIVVDQVAIAHIEYDAGLTSAISQKLATEQKVAQKEFELEIALKDAEIARTRARGEADALEIRAAAESKAIEIRANGEAEAIALKGTAQAKAQAAIGKTLTTRYLQFKAFDGAATRYFFVPTGKSGLPLLLDTAEPRERKPPVFDGEYSTLSSNTP